jgi:hypothetical protein
MKTGTMYVVCGVIAVSFASIVPWRGSSHHGAAPLSQEDRMPLVDETVDGMRRLRHPTAGVSFAHPGDGYAPSPELAESMLARIADRSHYQLYVYANHDATAKVVFGVTSGDVASRDVLEQQLAGLERESTANPNVHVVEHEVIWTDSRHEARCHIAGSAPAGEMHLRARILVVKPKDHEAMAVSLVVISREADGLASLLESLAP